MKWLSVLFHLGSCEAGPVKHTMPGLCIWPNGVHAVLPRGGAGAGRI